MICRQAIATKNMSITLKLVFDGAVELVNPIKITPLNSRILAILCFVKLKVAEFSSSFRSK